MDEISSLVIELEDKAAERDKSVEQIELLKVEYDKKIAELMDDIDHGKKKLATLIYEANAPDVGVLSLADGRLMRYQVSKPFAKDQTNFVPKLLVCERLEIVSLVSKDEEE